MATTPATDRVMSIDLDLAETGRVTAVEARVTVRGTQFVGRGTALRHPADPMVPEVGEELAAARALTVLAGKLVAAAEDAIAGHEGRPVTIRLRD